MAESNTVPTGGIGLDRFRLKTAAGNVYDPRFVGGSPRGPFDPKGSVTKDSYVFDIRGDERPAELWG